MSDTFYDVRSGFYDAINHDRLYSADDMNQPYKMLFTEGIIENSGGGSNNGFEIYPAYPTENMTVIVARGHALLQGRWVDNAAELTLTVPENSSMYDRIDSVFLRVDKNNETRAAFIIYRTGTPAAEPVAPASQDNPQFGLSEVRLANISVVAGATSIPLSKITDTRGTGEYEFCKFNIGNDQVVDALMDIIDEHPELITAVPDGGITTAKLAAQAVTGGKIATGAVSGTKLADNAVNTDKIRDANVTKPKLAFLPMEAVKITATTTTLGDIQTQLNTINTAGDHVLFDVSALGASMYLCTIFIGDGKYKITDLVKGRVAEGVYDANTLLTMAIAQASDFATQQQIDYLQGEIDELGGKTVLANWDVLGDKIADGTSSEIVDAGDVTDINWMDTVLGTTTNGLTVFCYNVDTFAQGVGEAEAKDYLFVFDGTNWTRDGEAVTMSNFGIQVLGTPATGEVMTIKTTVKAKSFTFVGYDKIETADQNCPHNWCLEQTYAPDTYAYDTYESIFAVDGAHALPMGKYYLPMHSYRSGKTFNVCFETAENLIGPFVAKSNGYWSGSFPDTTGAVITGVYAPSASISPILQRAGTAAGSNFTISILSDADVQSGGYTLLNYAGITPGNFDCAAFGDNTWPYSNIRSFLNDDSQGDNWLPKHANDIASNYNRGNGWLFGIDPRVKALIQPAKVKWTAGYGNANNYSQGQTYTSTDDVFLLSMKEMSFDINTNEGNAMDLYSEYCGGVLTNGAVAQRAKYNKPGGTVNSYRWSRSAITSVALSAWYVNSSGSYYYSNVINGHFVAPAFIIGKSV